MAKKGLNRIELIGNVVQKPEFSTYDNDMMRTKFSVATNDYYVDKSGKEQNTTQFHNVIFWGKLADIASKYLDKGSQVFVEGKVSYRKYTTNDGVDRYMTEVTGTRLIFLDSRRSNEVADTTSGVGSFMDTQQAYAQTANEVESATAAKLQEMNTKIGEPIKKQPF